MEKSERETTQESKEMKVGIGVHIHELRHSKKMKLADVAKVTEVSASDLQDIENGKRIPSLFACYKLAEAFQVTVEEIIGIHDVALLSEKVYELERLSYPIEDRTYTSQEYMAWPGRWELIYGVPYTMMTPDMQHQRVVSRLCIALGSHLGAILGNKGHEVFVAPFEVNLSNHEDKDTIVQPDITIVNGRYKLGERGLNRAPELVVEVLSRQTAMRDRTMKFELYKASGVQEYWIADPVHGTVEVYTFMGGQEPIIHTNSEGILESDYLGDFRIPLRLIFE